MVDGPGQQDTTASHGPDDDQSYTPPQPQPAAPEWLGVAAQFVNAPAYGGGVTNMASAIASNLTSEHVTEIIAQRGRGAEYADRQAEREHNGGKEARRLYSVLVILAILAVVGIIVFLTIYDQPGLLGYILSGIGGLIAGAFGGYGYAKR